MNRTPGFRSCRAGFPVIPLVLAISLCLPAVAADSAESTCTSAGSPSTQANCEGAGLTRFTQAPAAAAPGTVDPAGNGGLRAYDPAANKPHVPGSPEAAVTALPAMVTRVLRWFATAMISVGLVMMVGRSWWRNRMRQADEASTLEARRMLRDAQSSRVSLGGLSPSVPRRIQWTQERMSTLSDEDYARLCSGYWETRGYEATVGSGDDLQGFMLQLRSSPDRKTVSGLVWILSQDDGNNGIEAIRRLAEARHRQDLTATALMTRGPLSDMARTLATQQGLPTIDGPTLVAHLRMLTQDQQEALYAELDARAPVRSRAALESQLS